MSNPSFRNILAIVLCLGICACGQEHSRQEISQISRQEACGFNQIEDGKRLSLQTPLHFMITSEFSDNAKEAFIKAMKIWNQAIGKEVFSTTVLNEGNRNATENLVGEDVSTVSFSETWSTENSKKQADTLIKSENGKIKSAKIKLNAQDHRFSSDLELGTIDLKSLFVHELGHALGLKHSADKKSVMFAHLSSGVDRSELSISDLNNLKCAY